jgi:hypothetical protein
MYIYTCKIEQILFLNSFNIIHHVQTYVIIIRQKKNTRSNRDTVNVSMIHTMTGSKIQNMHGHIIEKRAKAKYKHVRLVFCIRNMILSIRAIGRLCKIIRKR